MENRIYGTIVLTIVALIAILTGPDIYQGADKPAAFYIFFFLLLLLGLKLKGLFPFRKTNNGEISVIEVGDTVKLKSGSKLMTVLEIKDDAVSCVWHDENNRQQHVTYPAKLLCLSNWNYERQHKIHICYIL